QDAASMVFTGATSARKASRRNALLVALVAVVLLPLFMWLLAVMIAVLVEMLVFVPLATRILRRRRLLADAVAVELTRNPDGLARALRHLQPSATSVAAA